MRKINWFPFLAIILLGLKAKTQDFYAQDQIQKIEISFLQSNWDYILDTNKMGADGYTIAQWVKINGMQFDSVGVKYKGNSTYNQNNAKNPFHLELDYVKSQDYMGYKDIKLSNGFNEPSFIREALLYSIAQKYMEASRANFAQVYVNGAYNGVYCNVEAVTKTFLSDRFFTSNNTFVFADQGGCSFVYAGPDTNSYASPYTMKSDYGRKELRDFCDTLNNFVSEVEKVLDVDRALWMHAFNNTLVSLDSYLGNPRHNFYIYRDHNNRFLPIIWDENGGFGVFNKLTTNVALTIPELQTIPPLAHIGDAAWPLIQKLLNVPTFQKMYIAHMRTMLSENISNSNYFTEAQYLQTIVDTAVQSDPNYFFSFAQYQSNVVNNVTVGIKTFPGITFLMEARKTFLLGTPEFMATPPTITNVSSSSTLPPINTSVFITADVTNAGQVMLGKRNGIGERFYRTPMFDDGAHGDGAAGDGKYGVAVNVISPTLQYYIYAENNLAGIFSPERAEHEYHILNSDYAVLSIGDIVINEIMAMNDHTVQNSNGDFSDWIELYNNSSNTLNLNYLNLSDSETNLSKWEFPLGTTMAPNSYLIVWADEENGVGELHSNFKFSGGGEKAILSYANGLVLDSVAYSTQTADSSWGRFPNATGPFQFLPPTFNSENSLTSIKKNESDNYALDVFPNPASSFIYLKSSVQQLKGSRFILYDVSGRILLDQTISTDEKRIEFDFSNGLYIYALQSLNGEYRSGKLIVQK